MTPRDGVRVRVPRLVRCTAKERLLLVDVLERAEKIATASAENMRRSDTGMRSDYIVRQVDYWRHVAAGMRWLIRSYETMSD